MRIGVIAPPWTPIPPEAYGGIEVVVHRLAMGFQAAGHEVMLFATEDSTSPVPRSSVLPEAEGARMGLAVPELIHVIGAYDALADFDIVHDHTTLGPFYAERFPGLTVTTTIHGPLDSELAILYARLADRVPLIAISHAQCKPVPHIRIARVIHHGIDTADIPFGKGDGGYFLFLGRMTHEKGAHRAMDAAGRAGVRLLMAAKMREPAEHEYFRAFVQPYLNEDLVYVGEVGEERKFELLAAARALLFPIRWNEPFGMVMVEALACGTPVIAFPEGAAPEVVEDGTNGFLCHDVDEMVEAIGRVDELDRAACRASVEERFSTEKMVGEHLSFFEELLAERS